MRGKDEITIGQIYWIGDQGISRILFEARDGIIPLDNGLIPREYLFGMVGDRCIMVSGIAGNHLTVGDGRKVSSSAGSFGTSYFYSSENCFEQLKRDIEGSLNNPKHEKIVRRQVTNLDSLDDFQLLVPGKDIIQINHEGQKKLALFEGSEGHLIHLMFRQSNGVVKTIRRGIFAATEMSQDAPSQPISIGNSELEDHRTEYTWHTAATSQAPEQYIIRDKLLKSKGIFRNIF